MEKINFQGLARRGDTKNCMVITIPSRVRRFEGIEYGDQLSLTIEIIKKKKVD